MGYQRLTLDERYQIAASKRSGQKVREIARLLNRPASTISRELRAHSGWMGYDAQLSHSQAMAKRRVKTGRRPALRITGELEEEIRRKLLCDWSPEQVSGRLRLEQGVKVSLSTLYRWIYRDARKGGDLFTHLRTGRRKRKTQKRSILAQNFRVLRDVRPMRDRPRIVDRKKRLGDLERDLMCGTQPGGAVLLTINDRVSRFTRVAWMPRRSSQMVHEQTVRLLKEHPRVHTVTNDNGSEFARHRETEKLLKAKVYFSRKGCAWERGANENTNGLLRQYFPRRIDFNQITEAQIREAEARLNHRPRKCLGYQTPAEVQERLGQVLR